jgi:hypothetical protein
MDNLQQVRQQPGFCNQVNGDGQDSAGFHPQHQVFQDLARLSRDLGQGYR